VLLAVLVPYYLTHISQHFIPGKYIAIVATLLFAFFSAAAFGRKFEKPYKPFLKFKPIYSRLILSVFIFCIVWVLAFVGRYFGYVTFSEAPSEQLNVRTELPT
jgi:hypothetical protein